MLERVMANVFISYAREDREAAHALAEALQRHAISAWWDRALTVGGDFAHEIEQQLNAAPVVVVLWSPDSVRSDFVRDESSRARDLHKLLPVRIAPVALPLGFGTLHTLDLLDWDGDPTDPACLALVAQLRQRLAEAAARPAAPPPPPLPLAETSFGLRRRRRRLLLGGALAGAAAVAGLGAWGWGHLARREAIAHLGHALADHFAEPPRLERAQSAYRSALELDDALAPAHYFLAHLYAQLMLRGNPPPSGELLDALRADARRHFAQALAHAERLDGAQRVIARGQLALLDAEDAAPALERAVAAAWDAAAEGGTGGGAAGGPGTGPGPDTSVASRPEPVSGAHPGPATGAHPGPGPAEPVAQPAPTAPGTGGAPPPSGHPSPPVAAPPRVVAVPAAAQAARARAEALFGADRDARLAATTSLTLDPATAAEALPAAIARARLALSGAAPAEGTPAAEALAQGLAATLALAQRASPASLRAQAGELQALLAALGRAPAARAHSSAAQALEAAIARSAALAPLAYLQIAHAAQRPIAEQLAQRLVAAGYRAPGIELTGPARAPRQPTVRAQGGSDPALGRWCQRALAEAAGAPAELVTLRRAQPRTDTFELWFDAGLCAPGGRRTAACA